MANSYPSFTTGQVPSASDWEGYFGGKVDAANGSADSLTITGTCAGSPTWSALHTFNAGVSVVSILSAALAGSASYANDTAAAAGGVPVGGFYRNGNFVMVRLS